MPPHTIIFDIGNVLVGWDPRLLYRKVFATEAEVEHFMTNIATLDWNEAQDAGRSVAEGTAELIARHPEFEREIRLYYDRWTESFSGPIPGTVDILRGLHATGNYRLLALTNWSAELFPWARESPSISSNSSRTSWFRARLNSKSPGRKSTSSSTTPITFSHSTAASSSTTASAT